MERMMKVFFLSLFAACSTLTAQDGEAKESGVSEAALNDLTFVYNAYFNVQEALAKDNFQEAKDALNDLEESVSAAGMEQLEGQQASKWMELKERLLNNATLGQEAQTIKDLRMGVLKDLSEAVLALEKEFGHSGSSPHYEAFCPMALNTGASWLQKEKPVLNPFYGKSMQGCGELKMEFQPRGI